MRRGSSGGLGLGALGSVGSCCRYLCLLVLRASTGLHDLVRVRRQYAWFDTIRNRPAVFRNSKGCVCVCVCLCAVWSDLTTVASTATGGPSR